MEVTAKARYIRMSPKKVRLVLDVIKAMDVTEALNQLKFINKSAAKPITKLLNSALANATNNFNLKKSNLFIKKIIAQEGPTLKRWLPRAFGRATPIRKRSSHISVVLAEKVPSMEIKKKETKVKAPIKWGDLVKKPDEGQEIQQRDSKQMKKSIESFPVGPPLKKGEIKETRKEGLSPEAQRVRGEEPFDKTRKGKSREQQHLDQLRKKQERGIFRRIFRRKAN